MSKTAMKLALEALEQYTNVVASVNNPDAWVTVVDAGKPAREAITALREALAEQPAHQWQSMADKCELEKVPANGSLLPVQQEPVPCCGKYETCTQACTPRGRFLGKREALANEALDKMAENARELGLDYEPVWGSGPTNKDYEDAMRQKRLHQLTSPPAQYSDIVSDGGLDPRNKFDRPAQQEPVALQMDVIVVNLVREGINKHRARELAEHFIKNTTPPQRTWVGLTSVDWNDFNAVKGNDPHYVAQWAEAKLKEKNNA